MSLCAVVLAGGNREAVIGEALESVVGFVDHVLLIDTGTHAQAAIALAREMLGDKCSVRKFEQEYDCATARNFALDCAAEVGFDWAVQLDTDERIHVPDANFVRRMIERMTTETVICEDSSHRYKKQRFFRLPREGRWDGNPHEGFLTYGVTLVREITFSEVPKTPAEEAERNRSIESLCRKAVEANQLDSRMWFYLGDSLEALGRDDESVGAFLRAATCSGWDEEVDWSRYRAALIRIGQGRHDEAKTILLDSGLRIPELSWLLAFLLHDTGRNNEAIPQAMHAARLAREQRKHERQGYTDKFAWYEGPHDVIWRAAKALGNSRLEETAEQQVIALHVERVRRLVG